MSVNNKRFTINLSISSEIFKNYPIECSQLLEVIPENIFLFLLIENDDIIQYLNPKTYLKIIPIYHILRNNPIFLKHPEIAQIDHQGNIISPYFCPNNPKLENIIKKVFKSFNKYSQITRIQLDGLEMPSLSHHLGCFCPYCSSLAEEKGIDLNKISNELKKKGKIRINRKWIYKKFPDWLQFRVESISNLAGRIMVEIRKINPDLLLGLNINFSENAKMLGQDYFYLALYLDMLNFIVNVPINIIEKKLLKRIRSITKKFFGEINLFLQIKVPNEINLSKIRTTIANVEKSSFEGLFFHISALNELEKIRMI